MMTAWRFSAARSRPRSPSVSASRFSSLLGFQASASIASSTPSDIAQAVVYLARANAVTGTTLLVDGGQHLVASERDVMFLTEPQRADKDGGE